MAGIASTLAHTDKTLRHTEQKYIHLFLKVKKLSLALGFFVLVCFGLFVLTANYLRAASVNNCCGGCLHSTSWERQAC